MQDKPVALVTGANKGIGFQIARELAARGFTVLLGSRDLEKGDTAAAGVEGDAHAIQLDVTDEVSVAAAADRVRREFGRLDVLVNNAGISHAGGPERSFDDIIAATRMSAVAMDELCTVFETNVFGVVSVTQAMLPLLREAPDARIVNVSSGAGSLTLHSRPDNPSRDKFGTYSASKTALNAVTLAFAIDLEDTNIRVNAVCPGFTKTDLNTFLGTQTVAEGARQPVRLALLDPGTPTGSFSANSGAMPW
ncbi:SDR family oxidoreductase [Pseudoruegeria sp. HB172150]|uniref:SDR family oxidoreductase n=1 Tax=Pseudoruegeria sp. HB172150 TaxID=2721164 RepID=UPI0015580EFE|nr:SDR family oxidoreductase [Pseudoruegeria sp. HB172150]